jgi:orotidine-5'-phosphate decarboxylase
MTDFQRIIPVKKSVIVAADVENLYDLVKLTRSVGGLSGIGGIKIGMTTMIPDGVERAVNAIRENINTEIIFDYQKGGNDIPDMGAKFAKQLKKAGIDAAIIFPFAGPATQTEWTKALIGEGLPVLTGGIMTHKQFLVSEGGYIADDAPERIYRLACRLGVRHFVVPGNKIEWVKKIRAILVEELGEGNFVLYAPGFITQTGDINECGQAAGDEWHAIVGSAIYQKKTIEDMRAAAEVCTMKIAA